MTTTKKQTFIIALLTEPSQAKAIKKAGITENTAYKYLADAEFKNELMQARKEYMSSVTASLQAKAIDAVNALHDIAIDKEQPASSRVSASKAILDNAYKGLELEQLSNDVAQIKKELDLK